MPIVGVRRTLDPTPGVYPRSPDMALILVRNTSQAACGLHSYESYIRVKVREVIGVVRGREGGEDEGRVPS